jgi:hypothetical protein
MLKFFISRFLVMQPAIADPHSFQILRCVAMDFLLWVFPPKRLHGLSVRRSGGRLPDYWMMATIASDFLMRFFHQIPITARFCAKKIAGLSAVFLTAGKLSREGIKLRGTDRVRQRLWMTCA